MVTDRLVPRGPSSVLGSYYLAPWPFGNPPIAKFWPAMLALNVVCGSILAAISAVAPVYWLRVRRRPVHFSLRSLFVLTTLVAVFCGALKWYSGTWNFERQFGNPDVEDLAYFALYGLAEMRWLGPMCLVLAAAHWLVTRLARSRWRWRWMGLHILTWAVLLPVGLLYLRHSIFTESYGEVYGWPLLFYGCRDVYYPLFFHWPSLAGDIVTWLAITCASGTVIEGWVRKVERQVPTRVSAVFAFGIGVICTVWLFVAIDAFGLKPKQYDFYPCFFGLVWLIFAIEVLPVRHWRVFPKMSLLPAIGIGGLLWVILSPRLVDDRLVAGLSITAGAIVAMAVDGLYRLAAHRDRGVARFVQPDCGEQLVLPIWTVGLVALILGMAMIYSSF
jgi:hypothetical protein